MLALANDAYDVLLALIPDRQGAGLRTRNGPITVTSCRLPAGDPFHGLVPRVEYQVRVRAIGTGHGPDSPPVSVTPMLGGIPTVAPTGITADVNTFRGGIVVFWDELTSTALLPIDGYRVVATTSGGDTASCISESAEITACVLQPGQREAEVEERGPDTDPGATGCVEWNFE